MTWHWRYCEWPEDIYICIYIYVCVCECAYICVCVCVCVCVHMYECMYVHVNLLSNCPSYTRPSPLNWDWNTGVENYFFSILPRCCNHLSFFPILCLLHKQYLTLLFVQIFVKKSYSIHLSLNKKTSKCNHNYNSICRLKRHQCNNTNKLFFSFHLLQRTYKTALQQPKMSTACPNTNIHPFCAFHVTLHSVAESVLAIMCSILCFSYSKLCGLFK
jgi:hypothetical protein